MVIPVDLDRIQTFFIHDIVKVSMDKGTRLTRNSEFLKKKVGFLRKPTVFEGLFNNQGSGIESKRGINAPDMRVDRILT